MEKKIFISVIVGSLFLLAIAILIPNQKKNIDETRLPWNISINPQNQTSVFGITLGETSLFDAQLALQEKGKISLFLTKDGEYTIEVFLDSIYLNGLKANIYLTLEVSQSQAKDMAARSSSVSRASNQTSKFNLSANDIDDLTKAPVRHITYIPRANLDAELIKKRFGIPDQKIIGANMTEHWLYADKGLDIALNPDGREVFQYVEPARFNQILDPLLQISQPQE